MKITSVKVKKLEENKSRLVGVASAIIDNVFIVNDIKIINKDDHLFLAMPSQKMPDGSFKDLVHPLNADCRKLFEDAILSEYDNC